MEISNEVDLITALQRNAAATEKVAEHLNDIRVAIDAVTAVIMCAPGQTPSLMPSKEGYYYYVGDSGNVRCSND